MARRPNIPKGAHPHELRARAFKYLLKARQAAENAEALYRAAERAERRANDEAEDPSWPWPCKECGAMYPSEAELTKHELAEHPGTVMP